MAIKQILKQVAGIDVAQKELVVTLGQLSEDLSVELFAFKCFTNNDAGFKGLVAWVNTFANNSVKVRYVMEATGVYHEGVAYFLDQSGQHLSVVLPNKISNYVRTLDCKTITDKTASEAICRFGLERSLSQWKRPNPIYQRLRALTRERHSIVAQRTVAKNQLHAEKAQALPGSSSIKRLLKLICFFNEQIKEIMAEIQALIHSDQKLEENIQLLCSICGIGTLSAATVLSETQGFELITSKKQLTSYAGLDVREKQSGTSVKGKPTISKRGNKHLRAAMHLPALTAIRCESRYKELYKRLLSRHGIKMKAAVAVQRKLLELTFTIFKTNQPYDKHYLNKPTVNEKKIEQCPALL
jgi:transposase